MNTGWDGIAPRCVSTSTTSTMGERIKLLFSSLFLQRVTRTAGLQQGQRRRGVQCRDRLEYAGTTTTNTLMTMTITALQRFAMAGYLPCCLLTMQRWQCVGGGNRNPETECTIFLSQNCRGSIVGVNAMPLDGMCDATQTTLTTIWTAMRTTTTVAGAASGIYSLCVQRDCTTWQR